MFPAGALADEFSVPAPDSMVPGLLGAGDRIFQVIQQEQVLGYLLSTRAMGRYDYFDYLVAYAPDLSVLGLSVITYRSSHGAAICQKKWLSQFRGYSGEELRLGKEIDALSGATISANAMVGDLRRCYDLMIALFPLSSPEP